MSKRTVSIRVMGDKDLAERLISIIIQSLESNGFDFSAPKYLPMYKNKKKRTQDNLDPTRTRAYITVYDYEGI